MAETTRASSAAAANAMLQVRDLHAWYGESHVLHGINFEVAAGETVTLIGRNGAGKSTTLKSIMGILPTRKGSALLARAVRRSTCRRGPSRGWASATCPEERGIYAKLSVEENLFLPPQVRTPDFTVAADLRRCFPTSASG